MAEKNILMEREPGTLMTLRFLATPTDEEFDEYLETYERFLDEGERYGVVLITEADARITPVRQVRKQARWIGQHHDRLAELCVGISFVLPSPLSRGVMRAILQLQPMPMPHAVLRDEASARTWVIRRLGSLDDSATVSAS